MKVQKTLSIMNRFPIELMAWIGGLILTWFSANGSFSAFTLCPLKNLGIDSCPGCGLGTSVGYILHGQIETSFNAYPLGFLALGILLYRIFILIQKEYQLFKFKTKYKWQK